MVTPREETYSDLGRDVIPALTRDGVAHVYDFSKNEVPGQDDRERGYWRDVGTIDSYFTANMDLIAPLPVFNLYNAAWPVYSYRGAEPPAKVSRGPGRRAVVRRRQPAVPGVDRVRRPRRAVDRLHRLLRDARRPRHRLDPVPGRARRAGGAAATAASSTRTSIVPDWYRIGLEEHDDRARFTVSDSGITVIAKEQQLS